MDDFDYMWFDEKINYDDEIYEGVYEEWGTQENQRLLMLELSQLRGEVLTYLQNSDQSTNIDISFHGFDQTQGEGKGEEEIPTIISWEAEILSSRATLS
ncbi:hypothetical protein PVK06_012526 [Gossypium arboreum]|uniref:Uncharacterized protein n=1 Tax=Gossypium arboreum TaxID=29729 RepID=A0ABR0QBT2_GOSAR|nr:hypothetical protein PVK06_012526 [Gossypium arboreum]